MYRLFIIIFLFVFYQGFLQAEIVKKIEMLAFTNKIKFINAHVPEKIKIYIDKLNSWISDISFDNWLSENDIDKIERRLIDKKKQYLFKFLEF